ncbi:imidazole glycerol phosphate synthase subunit HisF [Candidatus Woesearchaeota archaeon]|nr:imidazole glycerol phosphate synthase subunit HisF [Candidatus Woesearchaeota archaeon]
MLTKRIIPCLDVKNGQVVKGTSFVNLKYAGNPVKLARNYYEDGADELVFLDITASYEKRKTIIDLVEKVARQIFIPFTVGGGISTIEDIRNLLKAGADKISINTAAVNNPDLIKEAAEKFGSQCIVIAIDAKKVRNKWKVFVKGGRQSTGLDAIEWAKIVEKLGAGEILLTSMDKDGTKEGYDLELTIKISEKVNIPVIASGGAGSLESIAYVLKEGKADAALAASIFHYKKYSIKQVKRYLQTQGIEVRI